MRAVDDEREQAKRVWSSMELKQVHTDEGDVETAPKFDSPAFEDGDDDDLEDLIAVAHHRFEDDIESMSLLSASPPSSPIDEQSMTLSPIKQTPRLVLIGIVLFTAFVGIIVGFTYIGIA